MNQELLDVLNNEFTKEEKDSVIEQLMAGY